MNIKKLFFAIRRVQFLPCLIIGILNLNFLNSQVPDQNENPAWENPFKKDKVDESIEKGIRFILEKQHEDGSIHDKGKQTAMSALSLMAMAAVGHQPIHPNEFGRAMKNALDFILQPSMANMCRPINPSLSQIIKTCVNNGVIWSFILVTNEAMDV